MQVRQRHLRRRHQEQVVRVGAVGVALELREVPGPRHGVAAHHVRGRHLAVAVLLAVEIHHERRQGPLQGGAGAGQDGEPRSRHLGPPLQIQDPQVLPELPVRPGLEARLRLLAVLGQDPEVLLAALGDALVREVGDRQQVGSEPGLHVGQLLVQLVDPGLDATHLLDEPRGVLALPLPLPDLLGRLVAEGPELLHLPEDPPALPVQLERGLQRVQHLGVVPPAQPTARLGRVGPQRLDVQHYCFCSSPVAPATRVRRPQLGFARKRIVTEPAPASTARTSSFAKLRHAPCCRLRAA